MTVYIPQWTARFTDNDVGGEDHLGVEGMAQSYQQYLVPGIISTTDHARYYSFYCWILYRYINKPDSPRTLAGFRGKFFKRHELAFIAGCYSHHQEYEFLTGLVGGGVNNYKARRIWDGTNPIELDNHLDYFGNKQGGFGQYYRPVMQTMGLVAEAESARWVYRLTPRGEAMAQAFAANIEGTTYEDQLTQYGEVSVLSHDVATEYGQHACLCASALDHSADHELLLDAFFRFDQDGISSSHVRRRLTMALILDLVQQSGAGPLRETLRHALYLGWLEDALPYQPHPALADWYQRWRMVQMRHVYTAALQTLWAVFLDQLQNEEEVAFDAFLASISAFFPDNVVSLPLADYLNQLCTAVDLEGSWEQAAVHFHAACQANSGADEMTLFEEIWAVGRDPATLVPKAFQVLCQYFLRHYTLWQINETIWCEMAQEERLPVAQFMQDLDQFAREGRSVKDWLSWLYRTYCLGQHEIVALRKLRQNRYNTFKFYYQDDRFSWAENPVTYREPLRFPGLRLFNGLTILTDLGLVVEDEERICNLTAAGSTFLSQTVEM